MSPVFVETLRRSEVRLDAIAAQLSPLRLASKLGDGKAALGLLRQRADLAAREILDSRSRSLNICMAKLDALSPLAVLTRGFALVENEAGQILRDSEQADIDETVKVKLAKGSLRAKVTSIDG